MVSILGRLVTVCGYLLSMASFCFLPYLVVPYTSFRFTALQLLFLGPQIPLPHYSVYENIPAVLQNTSLVWRLAVLLVLMAPCVLASLWPNQRLSKVLAWTIIIGACFTVIDSLCNLGSNFATGFNFVNAHGNTLSGRIFGSLWAVGTLGILLGMISAFTGSVITVRSRD